MIYLTQNGVQAVTFLNKIDFNINFYLLFHLSGKKKSVKIRWN